jgi:hypothetical protein
MIFIIEEGEQKDFYYKGESYVAYHRFYNDGGYDVEVFLKEDPDFQVEDEIYEYAWNLLEREVET